MCTSVGKTGVIGASPEWGGASGEALPLDIDYDALLDRKVLLLFSGPHRRPSQEA